MSALTFKLITEPPQRVDLSALNADSLSGKTVAAIKRMHLPCGNTRIALGSLFEVDGDPAKAARIKIRKCSEKLDNIGRDLNGGSIEISGNVGDYLGRNMRDGNITLKGTAGNWVGTGMRAGIIEIKGNAGDYLASARPGDPLGMKNGTIHVHGNIGDRAGDRMRRGMVIVEGNAGDYCGARMLAGTIMVLGQAGSFTGFSMKRGTLLLSQAPRHIPATFNDCGQLELGFLRLLFRDLASRHRSLVWLKNFSPLVQRYAGDLAWNGKGELLILQTAP